MIPPSSSFKPKLNDQDYMELVCENGQILAKSRRSKNHGSFQNQRTHSLLDLYKTEYDESFKKNIMNHGDRQVVPVSESQRHQEEEFGEQTSNSNKKRKIKSAKIDFERDVSKSNKCVEPSTVIDESAKGPKNVEFVTAPPDEQSVAVGRSTELYMASSSMFSIGTSRDLSCCSLRRKYRDLEEEESTYLSNNNSNDESDDAQTHEVPRRTRNSVKKRKRSTEDHKLSERKRRNEINKKMRALQDLLPNCYKEDKVSLLDEAIKYMRTLQFQVQIMSMGNGLIQPAMMLPMGHYSPMGLGMHFNAQGSSFRGITTASSTMLSFLNQPTRLVPNSSIFSPLENCSQQFAVPSCVPQTQATSFTKFPKSATTSDFEDAMQSRGLNGCYYRSLD